MTGYSGMGELHQSVVYSGFFLVYLVVTSFIWVTASAALSCKLVCTSPCRRHHGLSWFGLSKRQLPVMCEIPYWLSKRASDADVAAAVWVAEDSSWRPSQWLLSKLVFPVGAAIEWGVAYRVATSVDGVPTEGLLSLACHRRCAYWGGHPSRVVSYRGVILPDPRVWWIQYKIEDTNS